MDKPWQKGYPLDRLKAISAMYAAHDAAYSFGAFVRMSETMVAAAMSERRMIVLDDDATPRAAVEIMRAASSRTIEDWAGPCMSVERNAVIVRRPAYRSEKDRRDLVAHIRSEVGSSPVYYEGWVECAGCRAIASDLGLVYVTTKIRSSSELVGVYAQSVVGSVERDAVERVGLCRLNLLIPDVAPLVDALESRSFKYADHYSSYNIRHSWTALALRGYGGDPDFIQKPAEMSRKWRTDHPDEMTWTVTDTPLRDVLPMAEPIIDAIPGDKQRIRLMRLRPGGGELSRHADITDPEAGVRADCVMRIHVPLVTNEDVTFWSWGPDGTIHEHHMGRGEAWYLDTRKPHRAVNGGTSDRIHLVLDTFATPELREVMMIPAGV